MSKAETLITAHLDTWSSAIKVKSSAGRGSGKKQEFYGIKKMRELILELAVRGLLVPQDADDEPASELLKKYAKAKAKLIKDREIKKPKYVTPSVSSIQFSIPEKWTVAQLTDIAVVDMGNSPPGSTYNETGDGVPLINGPVEFSKGHFGKTILAKYTTAPSVLCDKGDILVCVRGATTGRTNIADFPACIGRGVARVRALGNQEFVNLLMWENQYKLLAKGTGTTFPSISYTDLAGHCLLLPPLAEQHRIVAKVDELMALCDQLEQQQEDSVRTHASLVETLLGALTAASERGAFAEAWQRIASHFDTLFTTESSIDQLKQTILQLAVMGKLVEQDPEDESHGGLTVGDHVDFQNGYAFKSEWFKDSGVRLCRNVNVGHGNLDWGDSKFVDDRVAQEFNRFALCEGDIVLSLDRPLITTGLKVARITKLDLPCLLLQRVAKPVAKHNKFDLAYFFMWLHSPAFVDSIDPGRSNGVPHISTKQVQALPFILPPLAEQHRIVAKVDELMSLCGRLKARLQSAQATQLHLADTLAKTATHD